MINGEQNREAEKPGVNCRRSLLPTISCSFFLLRSSFLSTFRLFTIKHLLLLSSAHRNPSPPLLYIKEYTSSTKSKEEMSMDSVGRSQREKEDDGKALRRDMHYRTSNMCA